MPDTTDRPLLRSEEARRRQLAVSKRRATSLLAAVTVVFVVVTVWGGGSTWVGYLQATAAASMVGGLADWFAVTALFRHPLGLPIPHTAIVVERKDQFGATLGEFVQESFLTPDAVVARLRAAGVVGRLADWLAEPANASRMAEEVADGVVALADLLRDDDVHRAIEGVVRNRLEAVPLAPLAGQALRFVTREGRHEEVLDRMLVGLRSYIEDHREELRRRLGKKSKWWIPGAVDHKIFDRVLDGFCSALSEIEGDRNHELRRELDARLAKLATELETSPELRERGEQLKRDLLDQPELQRWVAELWSDAKDHLRAQAAEPDSKLRRQVAEGIVSVGRKLQADPVLAARAEAMHEAFASYVIGHFQGEIAKLVSSTIARWDAEETASRLELLLGPDLQYVRINGTVVGGAAGLALHALSELLR
ncbi:MAG: hypothetical protein QOJ69_1546 [Actinomycetota bacterium]|nr:hypothetical protein [Actinomycetota bacterium]